MSLLDKLLAGLSGVLVLALLVLGSMLYRAESKLAQVQTNAGKLDTAVQAQGVQIDAQARQEERTETSLGRREIANREAAAEKDQRQGVWETMRRTDEKVRDWADQPLPDSVFRLRKNR